MNHGPTVLIAFSLCLSLCLTNTTPRPFFFVDATRQSPWNQAPIAAAIFGGRSTDTSKCYRFNLQPISRGGAELPPPPPPPPLPPTKDERRNDALLLRPHHPPGHEAEANHSNPSVPALAEASKHLPPPPPPPPPHDYWGHPVPTQGWEPWEQQSQPQRTPSPYIENGWAPVPPQHQDQDSQFYAAAQYYLEQDLQLSLQRQQELMQQAQNLTGMILLLEQREELHLRQLDVLTERVLQVENSAAHERNLVVEYQANCTGLLLQVHALEGDVEQWRWRCQELVNQTQQDAKDLAALKKEKKAALLEAEDLAALIEKHRLSDTEGEDMYASSKRKNRGFLAWLFGWGSSEAREDKDLDGVYTSARSTLLAALQSERNSVHELETAVNSLQQNNTAISEQVKSRDLIIDELNDRIAVFEEDKLFLKAALKQLQKDLNAEAPRTQKLLDDLERSKKEIARLKKEIKALIDTHRDEVAALRETISVKEDSIHQTESNLTVIGTYVDRLEARLAEFAIARRDIEVREGKCLEIEKSAKESTQEREQLNARILELESEKEEVKALLQELASERARLRSSNQDLTSEIRSLRDHETRLKESLSSLNSDYGELATANMELQHKLDSYEHKQMDNAESSAHFRDLLNQTDAKLEETQTQLQAALSERHRLVAKLQEAEGHARDILNRLARAEAENAHMSQNFTSLQEKVALGLQSNRSRTISREALSIHLVDIQPQVRQFACKVFPMRGFGVSVALPIQPQAQRIDDERTQAVYSATSGGGSTPDPMLAPGPRKLSQPVVNNPKDSTLAIPARKIVPKLNVTSTKQTSKPLRSIRKAFAQATGLHGTFTKNYKAPVRLSVPKAPPPKVTTKSESIQLQTAVSKRTHQDGRVGEPFNAESRPTHPLNRLPPRASKGSNNITTAPAKPLTSAGVPEPAGPKSSSSLAPKADQRMLGAAAPRFVATGNHLKTLRAPEMPPPPSLLSSPGRPAPVVPQVSASRGSMGENRLPQSSHKDHTGTPAHPTKSSSGTSPPAATTQVTVPPPPVFVMPSDHK